MSLYPFKFRPIIKDKIWGGKKLNTLLNKEFDSLPNGGESWEISAVPGDESIVANGELQGMSRSSLIKEYNSALVGEKVYKQFGDQFPLLIKFIDAADNLSVQVHPDDKLAQERHNSFGKTEMWYVMQADKGAKLISGFKTNISEDEYMKHVNANTLMDVMAEHEVEEGDVFFIPAGRVHAIGAGILLAEIQQTSDITYRIYDFNRKDADGNPRELHTDQALAANDYKVYDEYKASYKVKENESSQVVSSEYFKTNVIEVKGQVEKDYSTLDSFVIYICVKGCVNLKYSENSTITLNEGESILLPATINTVALDTTSCKLLEVHL